MKHFTTIRVAQGMNCDDSVDPLAIPQVTCLINPKCCSKPKYLQDNDSSISKCWQANKLEQDGAYGTICICMFL